MQTIDPENQLRNMPAKIKYEKKKWFDSIIAQLESKGLKKTDIAKKLDITPQRLTNLLNGTDVISDKLIDDMIDKLDLGRIVFYTESKDGLSDLSQATRKTPALNIIKIYTEEDLLEIDPELHGLRKKTFIKDWEKTIAEYDKYLTNSRCFIIYKPKYLHWQGYISNEHFDTFITVSTKDETECMSLLQEYLEELTAKSSQLDKGVVKGGYKTTPIQDIKVLELDSLLFLETVTTTVIRGYPVSFTSIINNLKTKNIFPAAILDPNSNKFSFPNKKPLDWISTVQNKIFPHVLQKTYDQRREKTKE